MPALFVALKLTIKKAYANNLEQAKQAKPLKIDLLQALQMPSKPCMVLHYLRNNLELLPSRRHRAQLESGNP